MVVPNHS